MQVVAERGGEVEASNAAFAETIEKTLKENLQNSTLVSFTFEVGNPFLVDAAVSTSFGSNSEEFAADREAAEDALSEALGVPVLLNLAVQ